MKNADSVDYPSINSAYLVMDALRAIAAFIVVLSHVRNLAMVDFSHGDAAARLFYFATGFGHQAVVIFFVLSGFWIAKSIAARGERFTSSDYMIDRLSRLWIVVIPAVGLTWMLDRTGLAFGDPTLYQGAWGTNSLPNVTGRLDLAHAVGSILFLQQLVIPPIGSNGPLWSTANEFWYYLWYPAIVALIHRRLSILLPSLLMAWLFPQLLIGFGCWLTGAVLYLAIRRWPLPRPAVRWATLSIGIAVLAGSLIVSRLSMAGEAIDLLVAAAFAATLAGLLWKPPSRPLPIGRLARFGAQGSFSLYAIHFPIAALVLSLSLSGRLPFGLVSCAIVVGLSLAIIPAAALFAMATEAVTPRLRRSAKALLGRRTGVAAI